MASRPMFPAAFVRTVRGRRYFFTSGRSAVSSMTDTAKNSVICQPELGMQQGGCQSGQCAAMKQCGRQGCCGALDHGKNHDERKPQELHAHGIFLLSLLSV